MIIITDGKVDKDKVDVYWSGDFVQTQKVVGNGQELDIIYKEYGPNKFHITYNGSRVGSFSYFKTNGWHGHRHKIKLKQTEKGDIECKVQVFGPDADFH